jgi:DHA1 family multidrug resistance protein-like MFS transporter
LSAALPEDRPRSSQSTRWRRNLAALWFAEFTAIFGFSLSLPFIPLYLKQLGVSDPGQLAVWSGLAAGASGFSLAVMSPIWGALADRHGRRAMMIRAMVGGAVCVGLMGFVQGPAQLVALRFVQGASAGTVAAATALVTSGTPRGRVGWSLGILSSAVAVGSAAGPLVGGLAASQLGLRAIFWTGGLLLLVAVVPVLIVVREVPIDRRKAADEPVIQALRGGIPGTLAAVVALIACQALLQSAFSGFQPLVVLRLLDVAPNAATAATGLTFAASGLTAALAGVAYSRFAARFGFRQFSAVAAVFLAGAFMLVAYGPGAAAAVAGAALAGLCYGSVGPALSSMIGLEAPAHVQARVFGLSFSAVAIGLATGPLVGGLIAAGTGPSLALTTCAGASLALAVLLLTRVREPSR